MKYCYPTEETDMHMSIFTNIRKKLRLEVLCRHVMFTVILVGADPP